MKENRRSNEELMAQLDVYLPVVVRVHGPSHEVIYEVEKIYNKIKEDINGDTKKDFEELRKVTNNYEVPSGVCESYEGVYEMLEEMDKNLEEA